LFIRFFYTKNNTNKNDNLCKNIDVNDNYNTDYLANITEKCGFINNEYFFDKYISIDTESAVKIQINDIIKCDMIFNKLIICLHGWGVDSSCYVSMCKELSKYGFVICPDLFGFGKSEEPYTDFTVDDYADVILRLTNLFSFNELILVGHSFGCRIISKLLCHPKLRENVSKIILTGAAGLKPRFSIKKYIKIHRYKYFKKKCKNNNKYTKKLLKCGSNDYKNIKSEIMRRTFLNVVNEDLKFCYARIDCKVLLVFGTKDKETPMYMAKRLNKLIKNSALVKIKSSGHFSFIDSPVEFYEYIKKFLSF